MQPIIMNGRDFDNHYCKYYKNLENDFVRTEPYLSIDKDNYHSFSLEYIKIFQAICSEIDVVAKCLCKLIDSTFSGKSINKYCKCIIDHFPKFPDTTVRMPDYNLELKPWNGWAYNIESNSNIKASNPEWWTKYNKLKHERTTYNTATGLQYYKLANQENVLKSLAALFTLEEYCFKMLMELNRITLTEYLDDQNCHCNSALFYLTDQKYENISTSI